MSTATQSFNTSIPNHFGLFDIEGEVNCEKTINSIQLSKDELAQSFQLSSNQLRFDRASKETKKVIAELAESIERVAEIFSGNKAKTKRWFNVPNPHFGNASPKDIIIIGRFERVKKFIFSNVKV